MNAFKYSCEKCQYSTNVKDYLKKHNLSKKHLNIEIENMYKFGCVICNKKYKNQSGLWHHNKKCKVVGPMIITNKLETNTSVTQSEDYNNIFDDLKNSTDELKNSNSELKEMFAEFLLNQKSMNETNIKEIKDMCYQLSQNQQLVTTPTTINNNTINNTFNMNIFLNEKCSNAINFDEFINKITFSNTDKTIMIGDYVGGTGIILKRNLENIPVDKRPLHYLVGEDPHQQLIHIRQDDKWNMSTELNWMQQIHSDDDDLVENKNPIYYALQKIDDEKLKYLCTHYRMDPEYKIQHGRLNRETSRPDFKEKVYRKLIQMITLDTDKLDGINEKRKIEY